MAKPVDLDTKVLNLMRDVKARKDKLGKLSKPQWSTSGVLELPAFPTVTIQIATDVQMLVLCRHSLKVMGDMIQDANRDLELSLPLTWKSYAIDDWISDVEQRIKIINITAEKAKLATLEAKLNTLTSEDQRRAFALAEIESELS